MPKLLAKIAIFLPVLTTLTVMEMMTQKPELFWRLFAILISVVALCALYLSGFLKKRKWQQLIYLTLPLFYTLGVLALFILTQKSLLQYIFAIGVSIILGIVLQNIALLNQYRFEMDQEVILKSHEEKRGKMILGLNQALIIITVFFIVASLFAIIYLLSFPIWQALTILAIVLLLLNFQFFSEIATRELAGVYTLVSVLSLLQIFWALTFWPTNYIANGILIAIILYVALGLIEHYTQGSLSRKMIKIYFSIALISIGGVLISAQWQPR